MHWHLRKRLCLRLRFRCRCMCHGGGAGASALAWAWCSCAHRPRSCSRHYFISLHSLSVCCGGGGGAVLVSWVNLAPQSCRLWPPSCLVRATYTHDAAASAVAPGGSPAAVISPAITLLLLTHLLSTFALLVLLLFMPLLPTFALLVLLPSSSCRQAPASQRAAVVRCAPCRAGCRCPLRMRAQVLAPSGGERAIGYPTA